MARKLWIRRALRDGIAWQESLIDAYNGVNNAAGNAVRKGCLLAIRRYKEAIEDLKEE